MNMLLFIAAVFFAGMVYSLLGLVAVVLSLDFIDNSLNKGIYNNMFCSLFCVVCWPAVVPLMLVYAIFEKRQVKRQWL